MPKVTFVYPCVGRFPETKYVRSWQMQPLSIAVLAALTPRHWERAFFDDRLENIDYDEPTDLAAISIETFTARRGYEIAAEYRRRGVKVVMGGYHATFCKEEVIEYADAVCLGEAEGLWPQILADAENGRLERIYASVAPPSLAGVIPDRSIFAGKDYLKIALVEAGRGCKFGCSFCSITAFYSARYRRRPVEDIVSEISSLGQKVIFFVDDNVIGEIRAARELFEALEPLGIKWLSQASLNMTCDEELLDLMVRSGCMGLLIGFESLDRENLGAVGKRVNQSVDFSTALGKLRRRGIPVYGTFLIGLPRDNAALVERTLGFAVREKLFLAAFNHVVPFPGTPLYSELEQSGQLPWERWWLSDAYRFGQPPFQPWTMSAVELQALCHACHSRKTQRGE